jgi:ATP phosphoribosyltransferase
MRRAADPRARGAADRRSPVLARNLDNVAAQLHDLAVDMPALAPAVARFDARLDALAARGIDVTALEFEGSYGRTTLEYYDGFVFGFYAEGRPDLPPVATGGRYDALTRQLGRGREIPAVGGVIRPELALAIAEGRHERETGCALQGPADGKDLRLVRGAGRRPVRTGSEREYAGAVEGIDGLELVLLSAGEIPRELAAGRIHLGVTGSDLVREKLGALGEKVREIEPLGFGHADLVIAVPRAWVDVTTLDDLDAVAARFRAQHGFRLRIATKYHRLVRDYLREHGVADYQLVDSQGATEGTVKNETAEAIADITSTGDTLRANHLKILAGGPVHRARRRCSSRAMATGRCFWAVPTDCDLARQGQTSSQMVTGPSLTRLTCMSAPNRPCAVSIPCPRIWSAKCS